MTRKASKRKPLDAFPPLIVAQAAMKDTALVVRTSVDAFINGWATVEQFDNLADCCNLLTLGANERQEESAVYVAEMARRALTAIRVAFVLTGRYMSSPDELRALIELADMAEDFWPRQSGAFFCRHYRTLVAYQIARAEEAQ